MQYRCRIEPHRDEDIQIIKTLLLMLIMIIVIQIMINILKEGRFVEQEGLVADGIQSCSFRLIIASASS